MEVAGNPRFRFGEFEFDSVSLRLLREGRPVKIEPQPLRVLSVLLERSGEIVSREELRTRVWGEATFVEFDQSLHYCVRQIRIALREGAAKQRFLETLPKQGYRSSAYWKSKRPRRSRIPSKLSPRRLRLRSALGGVRWSPCGEWPLRRRWSGWPFAIGEPSLLPLSMSRFSRQRGQASSTTATAKVGSRSRRMGRCSHSSVTPRVKRSYGFAGWIRPIHG